MSTVISAREPTRGRATPIPFVFVAPAAVVLLGLAVSVVVAMLGVVELREQRAGAAHLRSQLLSETLAARLAALPRAQEPGFLAQASRRAGVEIYLLSEGGRVLSAAGSRPTLPARAHGPGSGVITSDTGDFHYTSAVVPDSGDRLVVVVPAPAVPFSSSSLVTSVGVFAALLVTAAGFVAWALARDVHADVVFVRTRIVDMAKEDKAPEGEPIPVRTIDQVGQLTAAFNLLLERFEAAERAYQHDLAGANAFDRDRSDFLAALSHELRTPLNAILGFTEVLLSEVDGPLSDEAHENLTIVRTSGEHLRSLIDDILALSAIESGELRLSRELANVAAIARDVVAEARVTAEQKGLQLTLELADPTIPGFVDARRVRQILGNVVGNAIKFTSTGQVSVRVTSTQESCTLEIEDTGPGIAADALDRIFDEYQQSGSAGTQRIGTGLGLAITRRLVQMHGGAVRVTSQLGQGARFVISLPLQPGRPSHASLLPHSGALQTPIIRER